MKKGNFKFSGIIILLSFVIMSSCSLEPTIKDAADTQPRTVQDLRVLMNGAYSTMKYYTYYGRNFIIAGELRADNVYSIQSSSRFANWSRMSLVSSNRRNSDLFRRIYGSVANPNIIINSDLSEIEGGEPDKLHILGEAYAIRALAHLDAMRVYGQTYLAGGSNLGISYTKEFKGEENNIPRSTVEETKNQLYNDIEQAINYLSLATGSQYANSQTRITLDAAYAIKSRIAIYFKDYDKALEASNGFDFDKYPITPANEFVEYWQKGPGGRASVFELANTQADPAGDGGLGNIYHGTRYGDVILLPGAIDDAGFEPNDVRISEEMIRKDDKDYLRNYGKYVDFNGGDFIKVIRVEEIILNHAEALLMGSSQNATEALSFLNKITANRNASAYTSVNPADLLEDILAERRKELLFEGFRHYDLARYNKDIRDISPNTINNHGLVPAGDNRFAMPIPLQEMESNLSLGQESQNPGY